MRITIENWSEAQQAIVAVEDYLAEESAEGTSGWSGDDVISAMTEISHALSALARVRDAELGRRIQHETT